MSKLIFVYNANSSLFAQAKDYVHKYVSPKTYGCKLCGLTWGAAGEKKEWRDFVNNLQYPSEFLHRDEFFNQHPKYRNSKLPAVFLKENGKVNSLIPASEINQQNSLYELQDLVRQKTKNL